MYAQEEINNNLDAVRDLRHESADNKLKFLRDKGVIDRGTTLALKDINAAMDRFADEEHSKIEGNKVYGAFAAWLDNSAGILAGKQSMGDRGTESQVGRWFLNAGNKAVRVAARAQVAGNIVSALVSQTSQWSLLMARVGPKTFRRALAAVCTGKTAWAKDFAKDSDFLTNKHGTDYIRLSNMQKIDNVLYAPLQFMDYIMSSLIVYSGFLEARDAGKGYKESVEAGDALGRSVMGSRVTGEKPVAFHAKGPVWSMLNLYQIEVLNQVNHVFQDMPQHFKDVAKEKGKAFAGRKLAAYIATLLVSSFVVNLLTKSATGSGQQPFDALGLIVDMYAAGNELTADELMRVIIDNGLENLVDARIFGTDAGALDGGFDWDRAISAAQDGIMFQTPFLRNVAGMFGVDNNVLPLPQLFGSDGLINGLVSSIGEDGLASPETGWAAFDLLASVLPGGRQLGKTARGLETIIRGGRYRGYGDDSRLRYPVEGGFWDTVRATMFGNSALPETRDFYASRDMALSKSQTALFDSLVEGGADRRELYRAMQDHREIGGDDELSSYERARQRRDLIRKLGLDDGQKLELYRGLTTGADSRSDKFRELMDLGLGWDDVMDAFDMYAELDSDEQMRPALRASAFARWVDNQEYTAEQAAAIKEKLRYTTNVPAEPTRYEALTAAGLEPDRALRLSDAFAALEPADGRSGVTDAQRLAAIRASNLTDREKMAAVGTIIGAEMETSEGNRSKYAKMMEVLDSGLPVDRYLDMYAAIDRINADDTLRGASASVARCNAIMAAGCDDAGKAALYRAFVSESRDEAMQAFRDAGLGFDEFLRAHNAFAIINERDLSVSDKTLELSRWANTQRYSVFFVFFIEKLTLQC